MLLPLPDRLGICLLKNWAYYLTSRYEYIYIYIFIYIYLSIHLSIYQSVSLSSHRSVITWLLGFSRWRASDRISHLGYCQCEEYKYIRPLSIKCIRRLSISIHPSISVNMRLSLHLSTDADLCVRSMHPFSLLSLTDMGSSSSNGIIISAPKAFWLSTLVSGVRICRAPSL